MSHGTELIRLYYYTKCLTERICHLLDCCSDRGVLDTSTGDRHLQSHCLWGALQSNSKWLFWVYNEAHFLFYFAALAGWCWRIFHGVSWYTCTHLYLQDCDSAYSVQLARLMPPHQLLLAESYNMCKLLICTQEFLLEVSVLTQPVPLKDSLFTKLHHLPAFWHYLSQFCVYSIGYCCRDWNWTAVSLLYLVFSPPWLGWYWWLIGNPFHMTHALILVFTTILRSQTTSQTD